ncbi:hypothetical protein PTKIN_Ptkin14bG0037800 [Pterospermum kingtungense]
MASQALTLLLLLLSVTALSDAGSIGVNYGRVANNLPTPDKVVELLKSQGLNKVKLYDTDATVLTALANTGITVVVALPNELLASAASDQTFADNWVQSNISKYYPATKIEAIAVGNEVFVDPKNTTKYLVPAMKNVHASLVKFSLDSTIKISSPIALTALQNSYPSSAGSFKPDLVEPVIKPMLDFLNQTGSYLMENSGLVDTGNGLKYYSLFEAQIDAVFAATSALKYGDVKMVVTETGWPSIGDENEIGASEANAASYNGNLVRRVLSGNGTPLRPQDPLNVYLFALFNENQKTGPTSERNYGLFYPNEQKVYDIPLTQEQLKRGQSTPVNGNTSQVPVVGEVSKTSVGQTWCVANVNAGDKKLKAALDYACGEGGADCSPIQPGSTCYNPNTLEAHASYAFNSYYQKKTRAVGTCEFGGAAYVVSQPPRYGNCEFPTGY